VSSKSLGNAAVSLLDERFSHFRDASKKKPAIASAKSRLYTGIVKTLVLLLAVQEEDPSAEFGRLLDAFEVAWEAERTAATVEEQATRNAVVTGAVNRLDTPASRAALWHAALDPESPQEVRAIALEALRRLVGAEEVLKALTRSGTSKAPTRVEPKKHAEEPKVTVVRLSRPAIPQSAPVPRRDRNGSDRRNIILGCGAQAGAALFLILRRGRTT
jgi:hypothetical protein